MALMKQVIALFNHLHQKNNCSRTEIISVISMENYFLITL